MTGVFFQQVSVLLVVNAPSTPRLSAGAALELEKFKLKAEKCPISFVFFSYCLETTTMEEKLVLGVSGYLELYDLTNRNYHDLNKKKTVDLGAY